MKNRNIAILGCFAIIIVAFSGFTGLVGGFIGTRLGSNTTANSVQDLLTQDVKVVNESSAIVDVAEKASPSVVSIVITQNVPIYEQYRYNPFFDDFQSRKQIGTQEKEVGAGTGFIVTKDGMIITNRHVVDQEDASYTVFLSDGSKQSATVVARDTLLDIAFLDIEGSNYTPLTLGTSSNLKVGQSVIAIGNALGEFSNTVSSGIVSGLSRNIVAGDQNGSSTENLRGVIQTDSSINLGNSGGPLLDIEGNVIGVNVAIASDAENIGFAIPIDVVKDILKSVQDSGKIERPYLGVRYVLNNQNIMKQNKLSVDYGALVIRGATQDQLAVLPGSPADKAGIVENDIILEVNGVKVNSENRLEELIQGYKINSEVTLKVLRKGNEINVKVVLDQVNN